LTAKARQEIESRLSHYSIPLQILQMVAESCGCHAISAQTRIKGSGRNASSLPLLAALDDKSIILLEQIFLECHDSFSNFRLAAFMSSKWPSAHNKFVMNGTIAGASKQAYTFDVCIHDRDTGELVALGMQNNDAGQKPSSNESLRRFLAAVADLHSAHPRLRSVYHASSYGYEDKSPSHVVRQAIAKGGYGDMDIKLLEYQKTVYFESKS
jgi:hypothetical protein